MKVVGVMMTTMTVTLRLPRAGKQLLGISLRPPDDTSKGWEGWGESRGHGQAERGEEEREGVEVARVSGGDFEAETKQSMTGSMEKVNQSLPHSLTHLFVTPLLSV